MLKNTFSSTDLVRFCTPVFAWVRGPIFFSRPLGKVFVTMYFSKSLLETIQSLVMTQPDGAQGVCRRVPSKPLKPMMNQTPNYKELLRFATFLPP